MAKYHWPPPWTYPPMGPYGMPPPSSKKEYDPFKSYVKMHKTFEQWEEVKKKKEEENKKKDDKKPGHPMFEKKYSILQVFLLLTALFPIIGPVYYNILKLSMEAMFK